ncbi:MAG: von Willebrand factor type A domain-containing protein, partial [Planctomycetes bacterium]|nr:von Willebrand factor type A domain-containing protein [Planctomycetota bacterium]
MSSTNPNPKEAPKQPRSYAELPRNCAELPRNCPELPRNCPELPRNCPELEPLLTAYALEELAPEEREEVAAHLAGCGPCREELDMLARAATLVAKSAPAAAALGAAARGRILEAAGAGGGAGGPPRRGRGPLWRWIGGLAAAAVVVAGVVVFWQVQALREREAAQRDLAMAKAVRSLEPPALEARPTPAALAPRPAASPEPSASPAADPAPQAGAEVVKAESAALPADEARDRSLFRARGLREENRKQVDLLLADKAKQVELPLDRFEKREADGAEGRRLLESLSVTRLQDDLGGTRGEATPRYGSVDGLKKLKKDAADARGGVALQPAKEAKPVQLVAGPAPGPRPNGAALVEGLAEAPAREREVEAALRTRAGSAGPPPAAKPAELAAAGQRAEKEKAREYKRGRADAAAEPPAEPAAAPVPGGAVAVQEAARPAPSPEGRAAAPGEAGAPSGIAGGAGRGGGEGAAALGGPGAAAPDPASTAPAETRSWRTRVDEILSKLDRRPGETPDMMFFRYWGSNPFVEASSDPLSTFAVDVDTASYTVLRAYLLQRNLLPPREAIRTEELVNYFDQRYAPPPEGGPAFAVHVEVAPSPFAHEQAYKLLRVGLKGREVSREKRKAASLVFVIDTSGSMRRENRLELAKDALRLLVNELDEGDSIGIVAFDREARTILEPTAASEKERILDAIGTLLPRQNTNVAAGLELGYRMANARLLKDGTNRVILISDGVANTGVTDPDAMLERVRAERERGIYLTSVGVGMGNLNDALLERLADRGNGQCVYVDRLEEARKAFVEGLTGTLEAIAKDVKIQVELDPKQVLRYRLLGYENRDVADSAFRDNKVDAGEVGAGHEVTALYELKLREDVPPPA